jgi:hypothetical protein
VFKKMVNKVLGKSETVARELKSLRDCKVNDLIEFKPRQDVPVSLRGETVKVIGVGAYQYEGSHEVELTIQAISGDELTIGYTEPDIDTLNISIKLSRPTVLTLFGEDAFSELWEDNFARLDVQSEKPNTLIGWIDDSYQQTEKFTEAHYFNRDMRGSNFSSRADDDSVELQCHACEGNNDDDLSLSIETSSSGETEVFACRELSAGIIEEYWPSEQQK